jgi:glucose/arabinose dehydrogenase
MLKHSLLVAIAIFASSCSNDADPNLGQGNGSNTNQTTAIASPIAQEPKSSPKSSPKAPKGYQKVIVIENLERPWGMAWLPDGSMLITERVGRVKLWQNGKVQPVALELPNLFASGQGGLMDIALHPQFSQNRWVYLTYSSGDFQANRTNVIRAKFDGKAFSEAQVIFSVTPEKSGNQHFGSRMAWLSDRTMLLAIGDGGNPPLQLAGELIRNQAQKLDSRLGKILRIKDDGTIPADNPFVKQTGADPAVWSYGHRNIQGLFADRLSGKIWSTEHGARGGDELNLVEAGKNYGWPLVTHSEEYAGGEISKERSRPNMSDPKIVWTPAIAPSGLLVYSGDRFPDWQGQIFAGGLVSKDVQRIKYENNQAKSQEVIAIGQRVRDVRQGNDGLIYILTDEQNGQLIRLEPIF